MAKNQDRSEQYVRQVADELMEQIQAGVAPWQKPSDRAKTARK